jgi:membrane protein YdbS with pleckstrin-like domain
VRDDDLSEYPVLKEVIIIIIIIIITIILLLLLYYCYIIVVVIVVIVVVVVFCFNPNTQIVRRKQALINRFNVTAPPLHLRCGTLSI